MSSWGKVFFLGCLLLALTLSGRAAPVEGVLRSEVTGQVGVYEASFPEVSQLQRGDVVEVLREGRVLGEATVMAASDRGGLRISLRGVFEVRRGDRLRFVRRPEPPPPGWVRSWGTEPAPTWTTSAVPGPAAAGGDWRSAIHIPSSSGLERPENPGYCWLCAQPSPRRVYLRGVSMDVCPRCLTVPVFSPHLADTLYKRIQECLEREWGFWVRPSPNLDMANLEEGTLGERLAALPRGADGKPPQVTLRAESGRRELMCACTALPGPGGAPPGSCIARRRWSRWRSACGPTPCWSSSRGCCWLIVRK